MAPSLERRGLRELRRALKTAGDTEGPKAIREAHKVVGAVVADEARPFVIRGRTGRLLASLRGKGTVAKAVAVMTAEYATVWHWGRLIGNVGRPPGNRKGPNIVKGRPVLHEARDRVVNRGEAAERYEAALDDMFRRLLR